ncbi:gametocyte-specific factor 1 homolog [Drosophila willistoni]|uniref:gametocyte-specific factor 1 homolog n=1 Tax=Drosophila willistoni TaxID=7260 RepID=UPI001F0809EF|nr:gametocyte-specific factor 1 homolog [Drosophila willistoni]
MPGNWVECPFNRFHRTLPTRLVLHLNRCARNYSGLKMVRCPFDITHVVRIAEMEAHVPMCPSRKMEELGVDQLPRAPDPSKKETSDTPWDDEPDVPTYNPALLRRKPCGTYPLWCYCFGTSSIPGTRT